MMDEQAQGGFMHSLALGEGKSLANKAAKSLAQGAVPTLDVAGFAHAHALAGAAVGTARKDFVVGQPPVAARGPTAVVRRDALTQRAGTVGRTIPDKVGDHLAGLTAERDPHPAHVGLAAHEAPEFVEFEHVAYLGRKERVA